MTVANLATEIFTNLGSPSDTTEAAIQYWLLSNVGQLNAKILTSYDSSSGEILGSDLVEIDQNAAAILKKMYEVYRYDFLIRSKLVSLDNDSLIEVVDDGTTIRRVNKNEVIKTLKDLRAQEISELDKLVSGYRNKLSIPTSVSGDDVYSVGSLVRT